MLDSRESANYQRKAKMLALMFGAWLSSTDVRPLAEESWVYLDAAQVAYTPQPQAFQLQWQGGQYSGERVEKTERGWRILFHVRAAAPVQLHLDESISPAPAMIPATESAPAICHTVLRHGETLWNVGRQLAGDQDPYLFVLALFAANRELLDNNPDELRLGDELRCPKPAEFSAFAQLPQQERRIMYRRLTAYGERLKRQ